ncbi:MAG: nicotinamide N-methylase [Caulobacterales bacterium 32-69-10]|nr:MAG: nicotinamide N-methylase [Caulobacterales bacterium 32-69-10]
MRITDYRGFILANTRLQSPPHTPELRLHVADEITPIWRMTEEALGELGVPPPFWAFAWAGGQAVARYILDHPQTVAGKRVLDVATGGGIVAIAAAKAGGTVTANDIDLFCEAAVALNAEANGVAVEFLAGDLLNDPPPAADVIVVGDLAYEKPMAARIRAWLAAAHAAGSTVLIGDPHRTYFTTEGLLKLAEYGVPTTRELEDFAIKRTGVWTFAD